MSSETELADLLSWAKSHGAIIDDRVSFNCQPTKGTYASLNQSLNDANASLLQIPRELLLTHQYAEEFFHSESGKIKSNINALLQLFVAKLKFDSKSTVVGESNISEKWKPYIDFLPSKGKELGTPYFWSGIEKLTLKGTDAGIILRRRFNAILEEWKSLLELLLADSNNKVWFLQWEKDLQFYRDYNQRKLYDEDKLWVFLNESILSWSSFPAYLWASGIFSSRAFPYILIDDKLKDLNRAFLLPIVDLLNHQNSKEVSWSYEHEKVNFKTAEAITKGGELFNNYGDKSNLELLLGYGFVLATNDFDETSITLKVDPLQVKKAEELGAQLPRGSAAEGINFSITFNDPLPKDLVTFFASLVQLNSEKGSYTLRMKLDGLSNLRKIIDQKIEFFKNLAKIDASTASSLPSQIIKTSKTYKNGQRKLFQATLEEITKLEKQLIKTHKTVSFKTILKNDRPFMNSLLLTFGVATYEDIIKKQLVDQVFLLWIVRVSNIDAATGVSAQYKPPAFVLDQFADVRKSIAVTKEDVLEYRDLYKSLFPSLSIKIPEIYSKGEWGIKSFIIAGTVVDRIAYTRPSNSELFVLDKVTVD